MNPWTAIVDAFARLLLTVGDAMGTNAMGVLVTIFVVRAALIPLLGPLAVRTRDRLRVVRRIRPQIKALDREFRDHPRELSRRLKALHEEHGVGVVDWPGLVGAVIQVPILIAMFQAVLVVWEPRAMRPEALGLGLIASALSLWGTKLSGQAEGATWMLWLAGALPVAITAWLGTGVGLYLTGFYGAAGVQAFFMHRRDPSSSSAESE